MDERIKDGGSAFPCEQHETQDGLWNQTFDPSMNLRDYFAAKAMASLIQSTETRIGDISHQTQFHANKLSEDAYCMADAMIRAREIKS